MAKIVYNACYGGFGLSDAAINRYAELSGINLYEIYHNDMKRHDLFLVQVVEELGEAADADFSNLQIRELPSGTKYRIDEYDGYERVMTIDDYEWEVA